MEFGICPIIFTLDTFVKDYVDKNYPFDRKKYLFGKRILIRKYYNKGAVLNFLAGSPKVMRGIHTGVFAVIAGSYLLLFRQKGNIALKISMGMLAGGGASNLFDRVAKGHVVDYFSFVTPWKRLNKIVFNLSDLFIFMGTALTCVFAEKK
ncbi:MAG: signal peptidase II [Roseburia sp.]|nr:signal peptidase II [Roseburia sp.]